MPAPERVSEQPAVSALDSARVWLGVTGLALVGLVIASASTDVQDIDEATYAEGAREMLESGDWIHTAKNYKPFYQHPPLVPWLEAASLGVFGVTSWAARLPNLLLAIACLALTWRLGRRTGAATAGWAVALLATAPGFYLMVKDAKLDMAFTTAILGACVAYLDVRAGRDRRWPWVYVAMALASLTKGPVGVLIPATLIGLDLAWRRDRLSLRRLRPVMGLALVLALAGPWYGAMLARHGWPFVERLIGHMFLARYFDKQLTASNEPWFYLRSIGWMFFPWLVPLGAGLWARARRWWRAGRPLAGGDAFLVIYVVVPFLALSLSRSKLDHYICPILPPAAVLAAQVCVERASRPLRLWLGLSIGLGALLAEGALLAFFPAPPLVHAAVVAAALLLGGVAWRSASPAAALGTAALALAGFELVASTVLAPGLLQYQPSKTFAAALAASPAPEAELLAYGTTTRPSLNFYARRKARKAKLPELTQALREQRRLHVLTPVERAPDLEAIGCVTPLAEAPMFHTSRPTLRFLRRDQRAAVLKHLRLLLLADCGKAGAADTANPTSVDATAEGDAD